MDFYTILDMELLRDLLGEDASLGALKQRLIAWTEGNPFFLEETVQTLVETHALVGERRAYRLVALWRGKDGKATDGAITLHSLAWTAPPPSGAW